MVFYEGKYMQPADSKFIYLSIKALEKGLKEGQSPFGCVIVKNNRVIASAHNTVAKTCDSTAHAEVNAIRKACKKLKSFKLTGCIVYTSCEPCPMCFSAIHWAGCSEVVYGATIKDAKDLGFSELSISSYDMQRLGKSQVKVTGPIMRGQCREAMQKWLLNKKRKVY